MLREINAARENNTASHQFSKSELTIRNMPARPTLLQNLNAHQQGETDRKNAGINTSRPSMPQFIDYRA